jgi:phosphoglycerol transferase MdoB-like AlkP superfamily enzyme
MLNEREERWINFWEGIGVAMRILAFGVLSIINEHTPFLAMWIVNSIDAIILTYCAFKRKNRPYMALNLFWLLVGIVGIYNSWE